MIANAFLLATPKKAVLWVLHQLCVSVPEMLHNKMQPKKCWEGKREREEERKSNDLDSRGLSCKGKSRRCQAKYYQNRYPCDLRPWQSARPSPHISTLSQQIFLLLTPLLFATTDRPFFSYSSSSPLLLVVASSDTPRPLLQCDNCYYFLPPSLPPTLVPLSLPLLHVVPHRTNFFKSSNFWLLLFFLVICILPRTSSQQATSKQSRRGVWRWRRQRRRRRRRRQRRRRLLPKGRY